MLLPQNLTAVIVEDDPEHVATLQAALRQLTVKISVEAICTNVKDAFREINLHQPDIVFLDIELDLGDNGFDLLQKFDNPGFYVIFTTQHNTGNNLLNAIHASALDFLTKAVNPDKLQAAINLYNKAKAREMVGGVIDNTKSDWLNNFIIRSTEGIRRVEIEDVLFAASDGAYTTFHFIAPQRPQNLKTSKRIGEWADMLVQSDLLRCHREWLVNIRHCRQFRKKGKGAVFTLYNGKQILVSESYRDEAEARYKAYQRRR